ncbi:BetR domain [Actinomyces succiniciruminis]|uniref:BetR domain n=1 Tax=Actinomyces succiniciruminis TaxID=1522002 RepID=A0A1L7RLH6_9ACTO|nr:BetR domain [Actinomyces succiniciruminis]
MSAVPQTDASGMTFNQALGFTVNQYLFAEHMTREQLGRLLGVSGGVAGKKVRGQVGWTAEDVAAVANRFGVAVDDLLPRRIDEAPADSGSGGGSGPVPRTGFEPAAFCSGGRRSIH